MKKCPYCAEEIQDEAIVCRYCKRSLKEWSVYDPIKKVIKDTKAEISKTETKRVIKKIVFGIIFSVIFMIIFFLILIYYLPVGVGR